MTKLSVKKPMTVVVAVVLILILGIVSFGKMQTDLLPSIDLPYAIVMTTYVGASPEAVESTVSKPVEQSMATISNIKSISSVSSENVSIVILQFNDDVNMDSITIDIRENLDLLEANWTDDMIGTPTIMKLNPDMLPVMVAAIDIEGMDTAEISNYVNQQLLSKVESVDGVASIDVQGTIDEKINVILNQDKIDAVNEKIQASVNEKLDDAKQQISDAKDQIESGKNELNSQKSEVNQKLTQAQQQITDARLEILKKEMELEDSEATIQEKEAELKKQEETLLAGEQELKKAQSEYARQLKEYNTAKEKLDELKALGEQSNISYEDILAKEQELAAVKTQLDQAAVTISANKKQLAEGRQALEAGKQQLEAGKTQLEAGKTQIAAGKQQLNEQESQLNEQKTTANEGFSDAQKELAAGESQLKEQSSQFDQKKQDALAAADISNTLTTDMIKNILKAQNFEMPAGYITEEGHDYLVRVGDKIATANEMSALVLFDPQIEGMDAITLADVADVFVSDNSDQVYAKVNGNNAVILSMNKQTSYSTAEVSQALKDRFEQLSEENPAIRVTYLMDQGMYINVVVNSVLNNLMFGAILAIVILLFFLKDIRPTAIIACSIPISVVFAIVLMYFSGVTLNIISLSGLAVGVGMLVDNSVVVIENIYRLRNKGISRIKAAVTGASQVAGAIVASTLTTVCVFLPIVFVEGMTRQLFVDMALTIGYSLIASLIVALTLVPMMSANMLKSIKEKKHPIMDLLIRGYDKAIRFSLRFKPVVLILAVGLLVLSGVLAMSRGTEYMPDMDSTQVSVTVTMPEGATNDEMAALADEVMNRILTIEDVETVGGMIGGSQMTSMMSSSNDTSASVYALLKENKKESSQVIAAKINELCSDLACEVVASGSTMDMSALGGSGISLEIKGEELDTLREIAASVADIVAGVEGTQEVSDGMENPDTQIKITVDKEKAILNGLTVAQVYQAIAGELSDASSATTLRYEGVDYPVVVMDADADDKMTKQDISDYKFTVTNQDGTTKEVALSDIAQITEGVALSSIRREGQQRYITVSAAIKDGYNIGLVSKDVESALDQLKLPAGYEIKSSGENDTINDAIGELMKMLLLAVLFIYLIMVAQFQSLLSPFIVMFTIPLAFTGGFFGLYLTGNSISVISMIGFVMLAGIIVNNGIVLVDYVNQLRRDGVAKKDALIEAGKTRMRPILMTALTTVLGLSTMAIGVGMGADMVQPIAIVTIGGLLYATITTLFVIPVLYDLFNRREMKVISEEELKIYEEI